MIARLLLAAAMSFLGASPGVAMPSARLPRAVTDRSDPEGRAVNCAAYLGHEINAVPRAARPPLVAAMGAWRAELEHRRPRDEADQYFASTFAVLRDTPPRTLAAAAAYCRSHAPVSRAGSRRR
jgi:hypothetical protein